MRIKQSSTTISENELFHLLLIDFQRKVEKEKYPRIEYSLWRDIKKMAEGDPLNPSSILVEQFVDISDNEILYTILNKSYKKIILKHGNSFGILLNTELADKWSGCITTHLPGVTKEMAYNNYEKILEQIKNSSNVIYDGKTITANTADNSWNNYATTAISSSDDYWSYTDQIFGVSSNFDELKDSVKTLENSMKELKDKIVEKEIKNNMATATNKNGFVNFEFGPIRNGNIRMSLYGFAITNGDGKYVSYDKANDRLMDVDIINFNADGWFYKMPKAIKDIAAGDVVFHNRTPVFVKEILTNKLLVVDPASGEEKTVLPAHSPFGFDYVTQLVSLIDNFSGAEAASESNPFGNMLPLLMLGNGDMGDMLPYMMMMNGGLDMSNPMMMYAFMKGSETTDLSNLLLMQAFMPKSNKE